MEDRHDDETTPLLPRGGSLTPTTPRLWGTRLALVGGAMGGGLLVYAAISLQQQTTAQQTIKPPPAPPVYEVSGPSVETSQLPLKTTYEGLDRSPPKPVYVPVAPAIPLPEPIMPVMTAQTLPQGNPFALPEPAPPAAAPPLVAIPSEAPRGTPATVPLPAQGPPPSTPVAQTTGQAQAPPKKPPKRWLSDTAVPVAKPVFPREQPSEGMKPPQEKEGSSALIRPASWAQLAQPAYGLYRTQTIHGILTQNVNSDIPGQVQILVTRPVVAEQDPRITVIEQFSRLLGTQTGKVSYGASRLEVTIDQLQTPSKVIIDLGKAKLADKSGAVGGAADVDNKIPRVLLGAGISAVLSIGARSAGGSPSGFQPNLGQDFARDASGSLNASGQKIVEQQISISPTLTLKAGEPVTIQLLENYSFQQPPVTITK